MVSVINIITTLPDSKKEKSIIEDNDYKLQSQVLHSGQ